MVYLNNQTQKQTMKKRMHTSKRILLCGLVILMVGTAALLFFLNREDRPLTETTATSAGATDGRDTTINYDPPTEEEKQQAEDHKDELAQQAQNQDPNTSNKKEVIISITSATNVSGPTVTITGFAQGIVEDAGTCTATLTKGGDTKTATSDGFADANTTQCQPMTMQLSPGSWQLTLSYNSSSASGSSTKTLTVQ
ncbi:MAG: hypothetical protein ACREGD_03185 [Candidatus Saccharimonadales bacterium]